MAKAAPKRARPPITTAGAEPQPISSAAAMSAGISARPSDQSRAAGTSVLSPSGLRRTHCGAMACISP